MFDVCTKIVSKSGYCRPIIIMIVVSEGRKKPFSIINSIKKKTLPRVSCSGTGITFLFCKNSSKKKNIIFMTYLYSMFGIGLYVTSHRNSLK